MKADRQAALWSNNDWLESISDPTEPRKSSTEAVALANRSSFLIPIEEVPLGARVPTKNPKPWEYDDSLPEPDRETWAKISITMHRTDGGVVDAELIRPRSWIKSVGIEGGKLLPLNIAELQVSGSALVTDIADCPEIADGEGSVVTARFITREVHVIARVEILGPNGQIETLEGTTIHPMWSEDRQDWVPLSELLPNETLRATNGPARVLALTIASVAVPVYNIEVHGEHVYEVGELGMLVHNSGELCGDLAAAISRGMKVLRGPGAPDEMVGVLKSLGRNMDRKQIREAIHAAKRKMNLGAADDVIFDRSGGMWDSRTGEYIAKIWELL